MYKRKAVAQKIESNTPINYVMVSTETTIEGIKETTYGIGAIQNGVLVDSVLDISDNRNKIESIVAKCNKEGLELCHLQAVAEDAAI